MNLFHNQSISNEYKSLGKMASVVYSEVTTQTIDGNRNRNSSGLFLPTLHHFKQWHGFTTGVIHSLKLVTWAIGRNKASNRTNKLTCSMARVDPTLHLYRIQFKSVQHFLLTKTIEGFSMLYTFLYIKSQLRITVSAESLSQANARRPLGDAIFIARRPNSNGGAVC